MPLVAILRRTDDVFAKLWANPAISLKSLQVRLRKKIFLKAKEGEGATHAEDPKSAPSFFGVSVFENEGALAKNLENFAQIR